jgi:(2Fe-2S) ferredoxin
MSEAPDNFYDCHVFCCVNERKAGHPRGCCADGGGVELRDYMKKKGKALRIRKLRVNQAGCLDRCELGPTMVIYPGGTWYHYRTEADVDEILERHVQNGEIVERLLLTPELTSLPLHLQDDATE